MTELTIDPASGLPVLPKNYFWRVKANSNPYSVFPLELQLRFKIWIFSFEESSETTSKATLHHAARNLATRYYNHLDAHDSLAEIIGDYPPKKWTGA